MVHFKTDSYQMQVNRISCDAEIGSIKRGWHTCNKKAIVRCDGFGGMELHYCKLHELHTAIDGHKNGCSL